jgi:hypothetical protein
VENTTKPTSIKGSDTLAGVYSGSTEKSLGDKIFAMAPKTKSLKSGCTSKSHER